MTDRIHAFFSRHAVTALALSVSWLVGCPTGGIIGGDDDDDDSAGDDDDTADDDTADDDTGDDDTGDDDTTPLDPPEYCEDAVPDELQEILTTPAAPYFVHHPDTDALDVPTVIFLPGGSGQRSAAEGTWGRWLADGTGVDQFRVAILFAADGDLTDEYDRSVEVVEELLLCYGGDPDHVHLGGTSNGGIGSFALVLEAPDTFATLLGAPGAFINFDTQAIENALGGKAVFNGVGEFDSGWINAVESTHQGLVGLGIESELVIFEGQGHILDYEYDETVFYDFWLSH